MIKINENGMTLFILILIVIGQISIDIYLPSMPMMAMFFNTSIDLIQLTLSAFLVGFAVSQLFYGPLSDYYGRKPILLFGLSIYIVSTGLCIYSPSIDILLILRFIQGIGIGSASVLSRAIMRDTFNGKFLVKAASYTAIAWALVPTLAPLLGGYIQFYSNWQMNFLFLMFFALTLSVSILKWLPETLAIEHRQALNITTIATNYRTLVSSRIFMGNVICVAILFGVFIVFSATSPFLLQTQLHLSTVQYGWAIMLVATGYLSSSYINSHIGQKWDIKKITLAGFSIIFLSSATLLFFAFEHIFNVTSILIPMFLTFFGIGLVYANCIAGCLKPFPNIAGSAGALYGFFVFLGGSIAGTLISHFPIATQMPLAVAIMLQMSASFLIYLLMIIKVK